MRNIGLKSSEWLASVGIHTLEDVAELGVVETYSRVKAAYPEKVLLNMLLACRQHYWTSLGMSYSWILRMNSKDRLENHHDHLLPKCT